MKELYKPRYSPAFPAFAKDYPEYFDLRRLPGEIGKKHSELVEKMAKDAAGNKLKADALVSDLFKKAKLIRLTEALYVKALARVRRGNPPGQRKLDRRRNKLGRIVNRHR
jgi:hypothetical protein